ncbi:hypothetical protein Tco_0786891 [Tanacetum coccineum]
MGNDENVSTYGFVMKRHGVWLGIVLAGALHFFGEAALMLSFAILGFTVKSKTKKEYMVNGLASKKGRRMKEGGPYESDKPKNTRNIIIALQFVGG